LIAAARGFLITVIATAVLATFITFVRAWVFEPDFGPTLDADTLTTAFLVLTYCLVIGSVAMLLVCVPLTLISSALTVERSWIYVVFGFLTGCAVSLTLAERPLGLLGWIDIAILGGLPGAAAGQIWWLSYRKRSFVNQRG
jgi:hypothetical protein